MGTRDPEKPWQGGCSGNSGWNSNTRNHVFSFHYSTIYIWLLPILHTKYRRLLSRWFNWMSCPCKKSVIFFWAMFWLLQPMCPCGSSRDGGKQPTVLGVQQTPTPLFKSGAIQIVSVWRKYLIQRIEKQLSYFSLWTPSKWVTSMWAMVRNTVWRVQFGK